MNSKAEKRQEHSRLLSFSLILAGCVFLCNPNVNLFDVLPDFIGYFLLLLALRHASEVFPHFDDAYRRFRILLWVSLAKIPATLAMMYVTGRDMDERGLITVFALAFAAIEMIFALPAFRALFEGFVYIGERHDVPIALGGDHSNVDRLTILTLVFLITKHALSFLPELVFLSTFLHTGSLEPGAVNPVTFYPILATLSVLAGIVFGLVWILKLRPYLLAMKHDGKMNTLLAEKYISFREPLHTADTRRRHRSFLMLILAGFFFAIDPVLSNIDVLPNIVSALFFFFAFLFIDKETGTKYGKTTAILYAVASIARAVCSSLFFAEFKLTDIAYQDAALMRYIPYLIATAAEAICFFLAIYYLLDSLKGFITAYTGGSLRSTDTVLRNEVHHELTGKSRRLRILCALYALLRPVTAVLMMLTDRHEITEEEANQFYSAGTVVYSSRFAWTWIAVLVVGAVVFVYALSLIREVKSEANLSKED